MYRFTNNNRFPSAKDRQHINQTLKMLRNDTGHMLPIRGIRQTHRDHCPTL